MGNACNGTSSNNIHPARDRRLAISPAPARAINTIAAPRPKAKASLTLFFTSLVLPDGIVAYFPAIRGAGVHTPGADAERVSIRQDRHHLMMDGALDGKKYNSGCVNP